MILSKKTPKIRGRRGGQETEEGPNKTNFKVKVHGGVEGRRSHGEARSRRSQMYTQTRAHATEAETGIQKTAVEPV